MTSSTDRLDAPVQSTAGLAPSLRVLVAEDEHLQTVSLCEDLRMLGHRVIGPVATGRAAVELAQAQRPDMALLDVRMPEMDGLEAGRRIADALDAAVVIVSAHSDREHVEASARLGAVGYLLKPVTRDDLRVTLELAWAQHLQRRALRDQVDELARKLEDRKLVERAKGLLMEHLRLSEPQAMRRLQKHARDGRQSLAAAARRCIEAYDSAPARPA